MLPSTQKTSSPLPLQTVDRILRSSLNPSRIVYIVTDDEQLGGDLRTASEASGIHVKWFRSALEYLAYKKPAVVSCLLISPQLSDMCGLDLQRLLAPTFSPPIIFLSYDGDIPSCVRAIREGAHDFLLLPLITSNLLKAMEAAFKKDQAAHVLHDEIEDLRNRWRSLTSREAEVMRYVVAGYLNKQTAGELSIAENTVQVHRGRVMRKMRADSVPMLVRFSLCLADCGEDSTLRPAAERGSISQSFTSMEWRRLRP
jgi:FixJ family two-component response regulator